MLGNLLSEHFFVVKISLKFRIKKRFSLFLKVDKKVSLLINQEKSTIIYNHYATS